MSVDVAAICLLGFSLLVMVVAKVVIEIAGMRALLVLSDQIDPSGRLSREFLEEQARLLGVDLIDLMAVIKDAESAVLARRVRQ
ncbi:hypothetical protein IHQ68_04475 [Chelatococcus sambhunathii]|uniref:Uncharacterized protein n=1 Tax=Chelatococcus sambhunathii TaxID=363953 RepID=A0ABU1DCP0_9HYPH|nr:hypothetical protein [Chelatococcus sambhunathii]MDR4305881.1 hypothetical protein [Chelatococcus sambhunathii]